MAKSSATTKTGLVRKQVNQRVKAPPKPKTGLVRKSIDSITPSPKNDKLYRPVDPDDPDFKSLVKSVQDNGLIEPITVTLADARRDDLLRRVE